MNVAPAPVPAGAVPLLHEMLLALGESDGVERATLNALARMAVAPGSARIAWRMVAAGSGTAAFHDAIGSTAADHMAVRGLQGDALRAPAG